MENTTITISKELAQKLRLYKIKLDARTLEEVIERILTIIPANDLIKKENSK